MTRIELNGTLTRLTGLDHETIEFRVSDGKGRTFSVGQIQEVFGDILPSFDDILLSLLIPKEGFPGTKIKIIVEIQK